MSKERIDRIERALSARRPMLGESSEHAPKHAPKHAHALRLFNGFTEGDPDLAIDLYAATILIHNYARQPDLVDPSLPAVYELLRHRLPWVKAIIMKERHAPADQPHRRNGQLVWGEKPDHWISEHGVRYSIDLMMNRDASFYLDTRNLRRWILDNLSGRSMLNTFAYTSSLGVAAAAAGASRVVHADLNKRFLNVAKTSYTLNGFPIDKKLFQAADFWKHMNRLKRQSERFDCVIVDPPFFSSTSGGKVDLAENCVKLINKVRPLVAHNGWLVSINNALFLSGKEYMAAIESILHPEYVSLEQLIDIPADFTGFDETRSGRPITDPAPFNHSTKIAVLRIRRKNPQDLRE